MKNIAFVSISILFLGLGSLRAQEQVKQPTVYKGVTNQECAVEVNFGSYGAGIDPKAIEKVQALIEKNKLKSTATNIGREGETRICLPLTELKGCKKKKFIKQLKKIANEGQLVSISIR